MRWLCAITLGIIGVTALAGPRVLAVSDLGFVYALVNVNGAANQIYAYKLDSSGTLTSVGSPVSSGTGTLNTTSETLIYQGGRLFALNHAGGTNSSGTVTAFNVDGSTGALTSPLTLINLPLPAASGGFGSWNCMAIHPTGSVLIVGDGATPQVASYTMSGGSATFVGTYSTGTATPFSCAFSRDGNYFYTGGNHTPGSTIAAFGVDPATGILSHVGSTWPFDTLNNAPAAYATDPSGRLFYATAISPSQQSVGLKVAALTTSSGALAAAGSALPTTFPSSGQLWTTGVLHPSGTYYLVADRISNLVGVYRIVGSGAATTLQEVAAPISSGGSFPDALVMTPDGGLVVAANGTSRNLTVFQIDQSTGLLTSLGTQVANTLGSVGRITGLAFAPTGPVFPQSFDTVPAPGLPGNWTTDATAVSPWTTVTSMSSTPVDSLPNSAFGPDISHSAVTNLYSPTFTIPAGGRSLLTFRNAFNLEANPPNFYFEGMVLEISYNGGPFQDILAAGGTFTQNGYNSTITLNEGNPLEGRQAWGGLSAGTSAAPAFITTSVQLPVFVDGPAPAQLRWRVASDVCCLPAGLGGAWIDSITLQQAPTVVTTAATSISSFSAQVNGTVNPNGLATNASFDWGLDTSVPNSTPDLAIGAGTTPSLTAAGLNLACNTLYYFRAKATNAAGTTFGSILSFTTAACPPPIVTTLAATNITQTGATLNGTANPNGTTATAQFAYGLTAPAYGLLTAQQSIGSGVVDVPIDGGTITGLSCNTTYHFKATATNAVSTVSGVDLTFTTLACPAAGTDGGFVYAVQQVPSGANQMWGFRVDATGALTLLNGFPFATGGTGTNNTPSEGLIYSGGRLYAINIASSTASAYSVDQTTGALTAMPFSPIALGAGLPACLAVHPSGSPLVVGSILTGVTTTGSVNSWNVTPTTATPVGSQSTGTTAVPYSCAFSVDGNYVYTGGDLGTAFAGFSVNPATGVLTPLGGSPFDTGAAVPLGYATDSTGRLFMTNAGTGQVRVLATSSGVPALPGNAAASGLSFGIFGTLHPAGFYMVADRGLNKVGVYQINGSGAATTLTAVTGSPFPSGGGFTDALALTQKGELLVAANGNTLNLSVYFVDVATGTLTLHPVQAANSLGATGRITGLAFVPSAPPIVVTGAVSNITQTGGTLNGTVNPNGLATTASFDYGLDTNYGGSPPIPPQPVGSGTTMVAIPAAVISGFACNTSVHFRAKASNAAATVFGSDVTFTTAPCPNPPTVATGTVTAVTRYSATFAGTANPNGSPTTARFDYGAAVYDRQTTVQNIGSGSTSVSIGGGTVTDLDCGTQHHFRATATNANGTITGADVAFTTVACRNTVGAAQVLGRTSTSVHLQAFVENGPALTGGVAIEYGTTLPSGVFTPVRCVSATSCNLDETITGLLPSRFYRFWIVGTDQLGSFVAARSTFTTCATDDCASFTDPVLQAGVTVIKAVHIIELVDEINKLLIRAGLSPIGLNAEPGQPVQAQDINALRTALDAAYDGLHVSPKPGYTDLGLPTGTVIKLEHIQQLRDGIARIR